MPTTAWTSDQLTRLEAADELQIAARRPDGTVPRWVPIWVVSAWGQVFVRTWHRRADGWFGRVVESRRARIRVPGLEVEVEVQDVGSAGGAGSRTAVDAAYRAKYGRYGGATMGRMVTDDAAATTLRLVPERATPAVGE